MLFLLGVRAAVALYRQTIVAEDTIHPERKLAIPGARSTRKLRGIEVKDPSFGLDAVWILPHQLAEAEADDHVVVEPESVIATHLSQLLVKHAPDLIGPDDVQTLLDSLSRAAPMLVPGPGRAELDAGRLQQALAKAEWGFTTTAKSTAAVEPAELPTEPTPRYTH